MDKKFQH